ncbi:RE1, partial [Symbiodinium necroappetens]
VKAVQLVTDTVDARVLTDPQTSPEELEKWIRDGLQPELAKLREKDIFEEMPVSQVPSGAKILPAKVVLTKKPQDPGSVDAGDPLSEWRAKARVVACGNHEQGTFGHDPENTSTNPSIEAIRWSASCLARNPDWTGLVLDVTAAFLNAEMDDEQTFVRPPGVLSRVGLQEEGKVWRLRKVLYGLRKGPRLWEACRNGELNGKRFGVAGHEYWLDPLDSGVWAVRDAVDSGSFHGIFDMYVDDGLIVGPIGMCRALAEMLVTLWELKLQGFLECNELQCGQTVQVGDTAVKVQSEVPFLGMVIRRSHEGVWLHQNPWVQSELAKRGWECMRGSMSLPEIIEGQTEPVVRDEAYGADLLQAQSQAIGTGLQDILHLYGDASLAPGASRSRRSRGECDDVPGWF